MPCVSGAAVWSLGCVLCEVILCDQLCDAESLGHQILEKGQPGWRSAAQLHLLMCCFGMPTADEIADMNPGLQSDPLFTSLASLQECRNRWPQADWRVRVGQTLVECGGHEMVHMVLRFLEDIFVYSPRSRSTAAELAAHPFWSINFGGPET